MLTTTNEEALQKEFLKFHQEKKAQHQEQQPGLQKDMQPRPDCGEEKYKGTGKLQDQVAIITGGDSGIGRAVAIAFAREGADVIIPYLNEDDDARDTADWVKKAGRRCMLHKGDIGDDKFCHDLVNQTVSDFKKIDILVNNAAEQHEHDRPEEITREEIEKTFRTNIFGYFSMVDACLRHMKEGSKIVNVTSVVAYEGHKDLIPYSATKGAITTYTRSLSQALVKRRIRVNGIAPGPIWTPLIPASFDDEKVEQFERGIFTTERHRDPLRGSMRGCSFLAGIWWVEMFSPEFRACVGLGLGLFGERKGILSSSVELCVLGGKIPLPFDGSV